MPDQTIRPVDTSVASFLQFARDVVSLANWDESDEIMADRGYDVSVVRAATENGDDDREQKERDVVLQQLALLDRLEEAEVPLHPTARAERLTTEYVADTTAYGKRVNDEWQVTSYELLLEYGGPTVTATLAVADEYGSVEQLTYAHSWGAAIGEPATFTSTVRADMETFTTFLELLGIAER